MKSSKWVKLDGSLRAGIRFNNSIFTESTPFSLTLEPVSSGIYAILAPDVSSRPWPFRIIYFGESANFSQRVTEQHDRFNDWTDEVGGATNLYVAFCPTPLLKHQQRRWVEDDLVSRYRPPLQPAGQSSSVFLSAAAQHDKVSVMHRLAVSSHALW